MLRFRHDPEWPSFRLADRSSGAGHRRHTFRRNLMRAILHQCQGIVQQFDSLPL
jgi:hypothetical protein